MKVDVLLGLQWGDEGKGKVCLLYTSRCVEETGVIAVVWDWLLWSRKKENFENLLKF